MTYASLLAYMQSAEKKNSHICFTCIPFMLYIYSLSLNVYGVHMKIESKDRALLFDPEKRWAWIKYQLQIRSKSIASIARRSGLAGPTIGQARYRPYPKVEKLIADEIGVTPQELFPDRYDADGLPNRGHIRKYTPPYPVHNVNVVGQN